jgi:hypothetical protein
VQSYIDKKLNWSKQWQTLLIGVTITN